MLRTRKRIIYRGTPSGHLCVIPAHAPVIPADNLPDGGYWVEPWMQTMPEEEDSWMRNYGFHVTEDGVEDVEEADVCYLGSFNLQDTPAEGIVVHGYSVRVLTEEEAEAAIEASSVIRGENEKYPLLDSYVFPSETDVITYKELTEMAVNQHGIGENDHLECLPHEASPDSIDNGYWVNVRLFVSC